MDDWVKYQMDKWNYFSK